MTSIGIFRRAESPPAYTYKALSYWYDTSRDWIEKHVVEIEENYIFANTKEELKDLIVANILPLVEQLAAAANQNPELLYHTWAVTNSIIVADGAEGEIKCFMRFFVRRISDNSIYTSAANNTEAVGWGRNNTTIELV